MRQNFCCWHFDSCCYLNVNKRAVVAVVDATSKFIWDDVHHNTGVFRTKRLKKKKVLCSRSNKISRQMDLPRNICRNDKDYFLARSLRPRRRVLWHRGGVQLPPFPSAQNIISCINQLKVLKDFINRLRQYLIVILSYSDDLTGLYIISNPKPPILWHGPNDDYDYDSETMTPLWEHL